MISMSLCGWCRFFIIFVDSRLSVFQSKNRCLLLSVFRPPGQRAQQSKNEGGVGIVHSVLPLLLFTRLSCCESANRSIIAVGKPKAKEHVVIVVINRFQLWWQRPRGCSPNQCRSRLRCYHNAFTPQHDGILLLLLLQIFLSWWRQTKQYPKEWSKIKITIKEPKCDGIHKVGSNGK